MQLVNTSKVIFGQIEDLITQLNDFQYCQPLEVLHGNTIGKHVRHILEFYLALIENAHIGIINYDNRAHETSYETDRNAAKSLLHLLIEKLPQLPSENALQLEVSYSEAGEDKVSVPTSLAREMVYNIEHAIHHMAIIRIAVQNSFPHISLPASFGIAYSTARYLATR